MSGKPTPVSQKPILASSVVKGTAAPTPVTRTVPPSTQPNNIPPRSAKPTHLASHSPLNDGGSNKSSPSGSTTSLAQESQPSVASSSLPRSTSNSNVNANSSSSSSSSSSAATTGIPNLEGKSKDELLAITNKLFQEVNIKNKLIYDLKARESWMVAELTQNKANTLQPSEEAIASLDDTLVKKKISKAEAEHARIKVLQTLLHFRKELGKARTIIEHNSKVIVDSERRRIAVEEECSYLKSILDALKRNQSVSGIDFERNEEFKKQMEKSQTNVTNLQSKLTQWTKYAKQHQDARVAAESVVKTLNDELTKTRSILQQSQEREKTLSSKVLELSTNLKNAKPNGQQLQELAIAQQKMKLMEKELATATEKLNKMSILQSRIKELEMEQDEMMELHNSSQQAFDELLHKKNELETKTQDLNVTLQELQEENDRLVDELERLQSESNKPGARSLGNMAGLKSPIERSELRQAQQDVDQLQSVVSDLQFKLKTKEKEVEKANKDKTTGIAKFTDELVRAADEIHLLKDETVCLKASNVEITEELIKVRKELATKEETIQNLQHEIVECENELVRLSTKLEQQQITIETAEYEKTIDNLQRQVDQQSKALNHSNENIHQTAAELAATEARFQQLHDQLDEANGRIHDYEEQIRLLKKASAGSPSSPSKIKSRDMNFGNMGTNSPKSPTTPSTPVTKDELNQLRQLLSKEREHSRIVEKELHSKEETIEELKDEMTYLEKQLSHMQREVVDSQEGLENARGRAIRLESELRVSNTDLKALLERMDAERAITEEADTEVTKEELEAKTKKIESLQRDLNAKNQEITKLKIVLQDLEAANEFNTTQLDSLRSMIQEHEQTMETTLAEKAQLASEVEELKETIESLRSKPVSPRSPVVNLAPRVQELEKQLANAEQALELKTKTLRREMTRELEEKDLALAEYVQNLEVSKTKIIELETEMEELRSELESIQVHHEAKARELSLNYENKMGKTDELETVLANKQAELETLRSDYDLAQKQVESLTVQLKTSKSQFEASSRKFADLQQAIGDVQQQRDEAIEDLEELEKMVEATCKEKAIVEEQVKRLEKELESAKANNDQERSFANASAVNESRVAELEQTVAQQNRTIKQLENNIGELESQIMEANKVCEKAEHHLGELTKRYEALSKSYRDNKAQLETLNVQHSRVLESSSTLQMKYESLVKEREGIQQKLVATEHALQEAQQNHSGSEELTKENGRLQKELTTLQKRLQEQEAKITKLDKELVAAVDKNLKSPTSPGLWGEYQARIKQLEKEIETLQASKSSSSAAASPVPTLLDSKSQSSPNLWAEYQTRIKQLEKENEALRSSTVPTSSLPSTPLQRSPGTPLSESGKTSSSPSLFTEYQTRIKQLEKELESCQASRHAGGNGEGVSSAALKEQIDSLTSELNKVNNAKTRLQTQLNDSQTMNKELTSKVKTLEQSGGSASNAKVREMEIASNELKMKAKLAEDTIRGLEDMNKELMKKYEEMALQLENVNGGGAVSTDIKLRIDKYVKEIAKLKAENEALKEENVALQMRMMEMMNRVNN